jgi:hypothetical protein
MAKDKYRHNLPEPAMAHELWSREICDRLDEVIVLLKAQTSTLVGDRSKGVQVEITEPDDSGSKAPAKSEVKAAPAPAVKPAPAKAAPAARATTSPTVKK